MSRICHAHCPGGGHGGAFLAVLALAGVIGYEVLARNAHAIESAAESVLVDVLTVAAVTVGVALLALVAVLVIRAHRRGSPVARQLTQPPTARMTAPSAREIPARPPAMLTERVVRMDILYRGDPQRQETRP